MYHEGVLASLHQRVSDVLSPTNEGFDLNVFIRMIFLLLSIF